MANTYRKVNLQIVFAVKNRRALLHKSWRPDLFRYIAGIINRRHHCSVILNGRTTILANGPKQYQILVRLLPVPFLYILDYKKYNPIG